MHVCGGTEIDFFLVETFFFLKNVCSELSVINALLFFSPLLCFEILINMNSNKKYKADVINIQMKFYVFV